VELLKKFDEERRLLEIKLAEEQAARDAYALEAAQGGKEAQRGVEQAETEIARLKVLLERNAAARRGAERAGTKKAVDDRRARAKAASEAAIKLATERAKQAKELDRLFAEIGKRLKAWGDVSREIEGYLRVVVNGAEGLSDRQRMDALEQIQRIAPGTAAAALKAAIRKNEIGSRGGVFVDDLASIPSLGETTFVDAAEFAADKVAIQVAGLLK